MSQLFSILTFTLLVMTSGQAQMSNQIVKESIKADDIGPPPPVPPPPPPAFFPGLGAGAGFQKNLDLSISSGAGAGYGPLLASLFGPGGAGAPPLPPASGPIPAAPVPPPGPGFDPLLGGPGYLGFPGFMGPSYIPSTWLGSALSAKGDLLFPIVLFVFVIVGIWTVVQFLLGLIVPLIAGKLAIGKSLLSGRVRRNADPDPWDSHQGRIDELTSKVVPAVEHGYGDEVEEIDAY